MTTRRCSGCHQVLTPRSLCPAVRQDTRPRCTVCHRVLTPAVQRMVADLAVAAALVGECDVATIAARVGRSPKALRRLMDNHRLAPTTRPGYLTGQQAARLVGLSPQTVSRLCREQRVYARRNPGGVWWLIPRDLVWQLPHKAPRARRRLAA